MPITGLPLLSLVRRACLYALTPGVDRNMLLHGLCGSRYCAKTQGTDRPRYSRDVGEMPLKATFFVITR